MLNFRNSTELEKRTDGELIEIYRRGDNAAFNVIYDRYYNRIWRYAFKLVSDASMAEDIAHKTFMVILEDPCRFNKNTTSIGGYLYKSARNFALKYIEIVKDENMYGEIPEEVAVSEENGPVSNLLEKELSGEVKKALSKLTTEQRLAIICCDLKEMSLGEAAKTLKKEVGAIKSLLSRGREKLKSILKPYFKDEAV